MTKPLAVNRAAFHITDSSIFRGCRLRWHFSSRVRLNLQTLAPPRALWLGTGVHKGLEMYYNPKVKDNSAAAFEEWARAEVKKVAKDFPGLGEERMAQFEEDIELGCGMLDHYQSWAEEIDDFEVIDTESKIIVPNFIPDVHVEVQGAEGVEVWDHIPYEGMGDMLIRDNTDGQYWVMEHKTAAVIDTARLILEEQPGVYQWAMGEKHGVTIAGVRFNFLRKKLPAIPQRLQTGGLTKRANIDTTHDAYLGAIRRCELDPADYKDILTQLYDKGNTFFLREDVVRSETELRNLLRRLRLVGQDMFNDPHIYPAPDIFKCKMCPFQGPCIALSDGSDWKYLLMNNYGVRPEEVESVGAELQAPDVL